MYIGGGLFISQYGKLVQVTSGTYSINLTNIDVGWYGQGDYTVTKSGYTPIAWSLSISNYAGVTNLQVETATVSSGQLKLVTYACPLAGQAKVNHTITVRTVWLKDS